MAFGLSAASAALVGGGLAAGGAVISGAMGASAAKSAAGAQADAARQANETQMAQYNQTREDQSPWRNRGNAAGDRLNYLLGLGVGGGSGGATSAADLVDTSGGDWKPNASLYASNAAYKQAWDKAIADHQARFGVNPNTMLGSDVSAFQNALAGTVDFNALNAEQAQKNAGDPAYGSLMRNFSAEDFTADPGYDFRLSEGMRGINNSAAARGGVLSGAALKAASKYNQNFASNEYSNVYNRFQTNQTNQFNRLASIAGVGQTATNQVAAAGQNMANNVSQNQLSAGNARASGYVGQANALTGAIGQGINGFMQYNAMQNSAGGGAGYNALGTSGPIGGTASDPWFG